ncbi:MAG TPA: SRPBCC family protein [Candidatus Eisenbacteria bacterium]|nr:SRPBCC family protein [Candidatus Eisenbacteria bacterium]
MSATTTDRIEKSVVLRAPRARVWHALTNAEAFGQWFGVEMAGPFVPGGRVAGRITHPGYEHVPFEITVERMQPERLFAWRWHPNAVEPGVDYSSEPTTLVSFELAEVPEGTRLTLVESGFDGVPLWRRATAYRGNEEGWAQQVAAIERYLGGAA